MQERRTGTRRETRHYKHGLETKKTTTNRFKVERSKGGGRCQRGTGENNQGGADDPTGGRITKKGQIVTDSPCEALFCVYLFT